MFFGEIPADDASRIRSQGLLISGVEGDTGIRHIPRGDAANFRVDDAAGSAGHGVRPGALRRGEGSEWCGSRYRIDRRQNGERPVVAEVSANTHLRLGDGNSFGFGILEKGRIESPPVRG